MRRFLLLALLALGLAAVWWLPDPLALSRDRLAPPDLAHPLGTDMLGRDVAARLLAALPGSLGLALLGLVASVAAALATALSAAWGEGRGLGTSVDGAAQALLSFPPLWLPLVVLALAGRGAPAQVLCVALVLWADLHWILRGEARRILAEPYVECARSLGFGTAAVLGREVLPNLAGTGLWLGLVKLRAAVMLLASLAFLGLGTPPPAPTWGAMIAESRDAFLDAPWLLAAPTAAIAASLWAAAIAAGWLRRRLRLERIIQA
ncbi:ABC transporter permease [Muricoccus radiodurans]|uniref:ABC transporter permease n=1 Tax=Muricoccus radiodurans TaxID=2231721 RepID=UPI003CF083E1